jgi:hypothetical protein
MPDLDDEHDQAVALDHPPRFTQDHKRRLYEAIPVPIGGKTNLTHIGSTAREVSDALDLLRAGVLRSVKDLESQLAVVESQTVGGLTA